MLSGQGSWFRSIVDLKSPPGVNDFFKGIPFYQVVEIDELHVNTNIHGNANIIARKEKKTKLLFIVSFLFAVFRKGFLQKISHTYGKDWPVKVE